MIMSNLEHELMAAERALKAIAEMTGADYAHFAWYGEISKFGVSIHNGHMVRSGMAPVLAVAIDKAKKEKPFDATPKEEKAA